MKRLIIQRIKQLIIVVLGISLLTFILIHLSSSDAVDVYEQNTGIVLSQKQKENMRVELGLDKPLYQQYISWLGNLIRGDMGCSYVSRKPVVSVLMTKLPSTLLLTLLAMMMTILIALPLGILSAIRHHQIVDRIIRIFCLLGNSMPGFFVALLCIYIFSVKLNLLPVISQNPVLPVLTLTVSMTGKYIRQIKTLVLTELHKEYVLAARARGIKERTILYRYALKAILPQLLILLSLSIGSLLGGCAVIETVFMWDGIGKMAVDAIMMKDYPLVQGYVIWMTVIYVMINFGTDLFNYRLNPKLKKEEAN